MAQAIDAAEDHEAPDAAEDGGTLADLLDDLGVPPERIRRRPAPGTATERDVVAIHDRTGRLYELVEGVLVQKGMGFRESVWALLLAGFIQDFLRRHDLGIVSGPDGTMRLVPGLVRIPDVAFVSWDRLPGGRIPEEPIPDLVPDLAVEILSRSNTKKEMALKLREYFGAGVWLVDPVDRVVEVFTAPDHSTRLGAADTLDGGAVLPGFALPLRAWFDRADRRGPGGDPPA